MIDLKLVVEVIDWADKRDAKKLFRITSQLAKIGEEIDEAKAEIIANDVDKLKVEIGDVVVTLIIAQYIRYKNSKKTIELFTGIKRSKNISKRIKEENYIKKLDSAYKEFIEYSKETKHLKISSFTYFINLLENIARSLDSDVNECLELATIKNKNRKGKVINGGFVKDTY